MQFNRIQCLTKINGMIKYEKQRRRRWRKIRFSKYFSFMPYELNQKKKKNVMCVF